MTGGINYAGAMESSESDPVDVSRVSECNENDRDSQGSKFDAVVVDYTCNDGNIAQIDTEITSPAEENEIMVRQRSNKKKGGGRESDASRDSNETNGQPTPTSSAMNSRRGSRAKSRGKSTPLGIKIIAGLGFVVASLVMVWLYWQQTLANMVNTPLDVPRVIASDEGSIQQDPDRFWGTYRPGVYFGMKTKSPQSLVTGLMWFTQFSKERPLPIRHTCEQGDHLPRYGWLMHNGKDFGSQEIVDKNFTLTTEFVKRPGGKNGGDWTARFTGKPNKKSSNQTLVSLMFYAALDGQGVLEPTLRENRIIEIHGETEELGHFIIKFPRSASTKQSHYLRTYSPGLHMLKDTVARNLRMFPYGANRQFLLGLEGEDIRYKQYFPDEEPNFLVQQVTVSLPFEIEVMFESSSFRKRKVGLNGKELTKELDKHKVDFEKKFESKFGLTKKGFTANQIRVAKAAMSNLLGGIGYFYGKSIVKSQYNSDPVQYWASPLLTAVPSRSFFPRGFLWDEGFHNLLISKWDQELSEEIIGHWLDLMNAEGWIPREQILGSEARVKVPNEFVVQRNENANPPTLFLPIQSLLRDTKSKRNKLFMDYLRHIYPRLQVWYNWFNTTQTGPVNWSYRWRGRDPTINNELNPKTLTSGLDDYPRASHPSDLERHIDLRCWMTLASGVMSEIAQAIGEPFADYQTMYEKLSDNKLLGELHWSERGKMFSDYGNHTQNVALQHPAPPPMPKPQPGKRPVRPPKLPMVRVLTSKSGPSYKFVDTFGYMSLFPFVLEILEPDSPYLGQILSDLNNAKLLWTKYGLRSLSKSDPLYMKYNTEHDPPYWRGAIWINMNYLTVRALHHYANVEGPYKKVALLRYTELRQNLIKNIVLQYEKTGYIWENYNDITGKGQGSHPFTGWSSLLLLMMAENY
ncbi:mannosyl-oligosaccharide glucosidase-like [Amphiura filiformis]|uniref:mannosyl-oligosaccharide glucosidase-like n=1 Tax=Amphiura filiformis TaxID=82378 RepID=UPI003B21671C